MTVCAVVTATPPELLSGLLEPPTQSRPRRSSPLAVERRCASETFRGVPSGHEGSHHFLVDDFVKAVNSQTLPPVNAWVAARFTLPGIVAHASALRGGERLPIRDFGDAPASL